MKIQIEDLLDSRGKVKILKTLALNEELTISLIIKKAGLDRSLVEKHLEYFKMVDLVQEKKFGRIRIFRYKLENIIVKSFKNFVAICEAEGRI